MGKKICFAFNHLQYSDGVARAALSMANRLVEEKDCDVTLRPIFIFDPETKKMINPKVKIKPLFGFWIRGMVTLFWKLPGRLIHALVFGTKHEYDIEVGFQHGPATVGAVSSNDTSTQHYVWIHGYDSELKLKKYYAMADKVICVSKMNSIRVKKEVPEIKCADYCYNPTDEESIFKKITENVDYPANNDGIKLVTVGRLSEEKGYCRLISVLARLRNDGYDFSLVIIGDGPERERLMKHVEELSMGDRIIFLLEQKNPFKYVSKSDVFVCSSFSEGYSTVCTEACILNIPVITTSVGGAEEIINDAGCGVICENSEEGLYDALKSVFDNPEMISEWKKTLENTKKNFFASERVKRLYRILDV